MLNFKEFLKEIYDQPYTIRHLSDFRAHRYLHSYSFRTEDGRQGEVNFEADPGPLFYADDDEIYQHIWKMDFRINGDTTTTGEGDAFRIFATVIEAMKHFYTHEREMISGIEFSASRENDGKESRIKLYRRMLNKFAGEYDFYVKEEPGRNGVYFHLYLN